MSWITDSQPVLVKELRGRMRGGRAFVVLTLFLTVLSLFMLLLYLAVRTNVGNDPFSAGQTIGKTLFIGVVTIALIQVMIIVPSQAATAITSERERETFDLLVATLLPSWKIVLGKLFAALAYAVLLIVAVVPLMGIAFFFGGVTGTEVAIALLGLLVTAILYGAIGILWSVLAARTMGATVLAQAVNIGVLLGIPFGYYVLAVLIFRDPSDVPAWAETYAFVYVAGAFAAVHPFIALGAAEAFLSSGETRLFFPVPFGQEEFWIPAPWLAYTVVGLTIALIVIAIAIRALRPSAARRQEVRERRQAPPNRKERTREGEPLNESA
jgi:ABC-2 type transport system permease protein